MNNATRPRAAIAGVVHPALEPRPSARLGLGLCVFALLLCAQAVPARAQAVAPTAVQPAADEPPRLSMLARLLKLPNSLAVADAADGQALSLAEAQLAARAWSTDVEAAQQRVKSFGHARDAARGALLPRADARLAAGRGELTSVDPALRLERREKMLSLRQALFDESARYEWNRQRLLVGSAELQLDDAVSQALLDSGVAYLTGLQLRVTIELGAEYEQLLAELMRYVSERAQAGGASPADRERVRSRVANVRSGLADTRSNLVAALRNLQRVTGRSIGAFRLDARGSEVGVPERLDALTLARTNNPELLAARTEAIAAEADRQGLQSRFLPRAELEITYNRSTNAAGTASQINDTKVMLNLTLPLLNGGADLARMRGAESRRAELNAQALGVERKLALEVETAYANLDAATARFASVREELEANRKVVDAFRAQLLGGNRSLLDVLDAFQRLHQSRVDLSQLLVTQAQTRLRIAHLTGTLTPALLPAAGATAP